VKKLVLLCCLVALNSFASIKISTFNIRNFEKRVNGTDKIELLKIINSLDSDIISVQEIYNNSSFEKFVSKNLPQYRLLLSNCGGGGQQNLGFLYKSQKLELKKQAEDSTIASLDDIVPTYGCAALRPAMLGFFKDKRSKEEFVAVAVHLKAGSGSRNYSKRWKQYDYLVKMVRSLRLARNQNIILLGDFNTTGFDLKDQDYIKFNKMLTDVGAQSASERISCTSYWSGRDYNDDIEEPSTLDHIVFTNNFMGKKLKSVKVSSHCKVAQCQSVYESVLGRSYDFVSDHCPVSAEFE
jgi:endonuclease/exonuclease/phosphatase family metal-dependent hydrolase